MNFQSTYPASDHTTNCFVCYRRVALRDTMADLDGPPFVAYYCPECYRAQQSKVAS
jgi:hypothetical protein